MKRLLVFWLLYGSIVYGMNPCDQPKGDRGPCDGKYPRWSYDRLTNKCFRFTFTGCMGNQSQFHSPKECTGMCVITKKPKSMLRLPPAYMER